MEPLSLRDSVESRACVEEGWEELAAAIEAARGRWDDRILAPEDGAADPWSPRLAAWHAIAGERFRTLYLEHLIESAPEAPPDMMTYGAASGSPRVDQQQLREEFRATRTPDEMRERLRDARDSWSRAAGRLADHHLDARATLSDFMHLYLKEHGQAPEDTLRGILLHGSVHLRDHARQIVAAL